MSNEFKASDDCFVIPSKLTISNVVEIKQSFLEAPRTHQTRIDISGVEVVDLAGVQLLVALLGRESNGGLPRLCELSTPVAQALERAGVNLPATP